MTNHRGRVTGLAISGAIIFSANSAIAQIIEDTTLPQNSQVKPEVNNIIDIEGGTQVGGNLFHSFKQFSILDGKTAQFKNSANVENIITRVTGNSISNIQGTLKLENTANLFVINPNGIVFGPNASLQNVGSFIASTASSLNFADGTKFSATEPQTTSLLTISVPNGLQFGTNAAAITNQSQAQDPNTNFTVGLQVQPGKTLALVGGDITLEGGRLRAESGRIELGSVASNSLVSLNLTAQGWALGYDGVKNFQNIQLIPRILDGANDIPSVVNTSGEGGGSINMQGKIVTISGYEAGLLSTTLGNTNGQDITITAQKLIVQDGAQVRNLSLDNGNAGNLIINASESVEIIGQVNGTASSLTTTSAGQGNAGNITINTRKLRIIDGASVRANSSLIQEGLADEGNAGSVIVNASDSVEIAGNLTESKNSILSASNTNNTNPGTVSITTEKLIVRDGGEIKVNYYDLSVPNNTSNLTTPGQINVTARSILLDNKAKLLAGSTSGSAGNITLQVQELLLMRGESQISASAGTTQANGNGGNITIDAPNGFVVAAPLNNDITANGSSGSGGKIAINAENIFGFELRTRADIEKLLNTQDPKKLDPSKLQTNDITAFSQENPSLNGIVEINTPDIDPSKGLVEIPVNLLDTSGQIASACNPGGKLTTGSFQVTGRGGIAPSPRDPLMSYDAVPANWITLEQEGDNQANGVQNTVVIPEQNQTTDELQKVNSVSNPTQIVEAQGWVIDAKGNVVLVAQAPTVTPHSPFLTPASCTVNSAVTH